MATRGLSHIHRVLYRKLIQCVNIHLHITIKILTVGKIHFLSQFSLSFLNCQGFNRT